MVLTRHKCHIGLNFLFIYFKIRDFFSPPINTLRRIGIDPGWKVLDYGCGSGSFSISAAELVGPLGRVYATDIHEIAIHEVQKKARVKNLNNIETLLTSSNMPLPSDSIDLVLLFNVLHEFKDPNVIIVELNRVLKPGGLMSVVDHKLDNVKVISVITGATDDLKFVETRSRKGKAKGEMLIFSTKQR